ncbi:MAG: flagellar hook-associated protein FlgK [Paracoccaceae bacterium]|nr:flagellar hook-associated protein FlgK [Paracoccaceae bacterium]
MSISAAMNNAVSGLNAQSRMAATVSSNVANATTEGYGRQEVNLSSRETGGVKVDGVRRDVDETLIADRQLADAEVGYDEAVVGFQTATEELLGTPDDPASLTGRINTFEAAVIEASAAPDSEARLEGVYDAAVDVATGFEEASDGLQELRMEADEAIAADVQRLNDGVQNVAALNADILRAEAAGRDASALLDQRQRAVDDIAGIVPLKTLPQENGTVKLMTTTGAMLLDITPVEIGFEPVGVITPDMTIESGALSGLTINGVAVSTSGNAAPLAGGSLGAAFDVRDTLAPQAQAELDAVARDFVERFQDPAVDPTLAAGDPGLFTDGGGAFDPANEVGLSGRIEVNARVDPDQGGSISRLRDGLGAVTEGPVGDNAILVNLGDALRDQRVPASGTVSSGARSASGLAGDLLSMVSVDRQSAEQRLSFSSASQESLQSAELANGVDTDQEMQRLLLIEQAYSANAQVLSTIEEMIDAILRI